MVTIKDVAVAAKCSAATVSKALNGRKDISWEMREKVLQVASSLNYISHGAGRSLKDVKTENIGVIFSKETRPLSLNPFYSRVLEGIEAELALNNYNLVLNILNGDAASDYPKMLKEKNVDGVILISVVNEKVKNQLLDMKLPTVHVDPDRRTDEFHQVVIDNEHGAYLATNHLIKMGHQKIAFVSPDIDRDSFNLRYRGFCKAMKYNHLAINDSYVQIQGLESGYEQIKYLVSLPDRPTAIFITNDLNVMYAYQAIKDSQLSIPDDISVVGFDDVAWSQIASPSLSTIRVYKEEMGSIAVRMLIDAIESGNEKPVTTVVPVKLIIRESVKRMIL